MAKKTEKKSKSESKTPELTKAKKALDAYLKENKLDPTKDWTKDKKPVSYTHLTLPTT